MTSAWLIEREDVALCYAVCAGQPQWVTFTDHAAMRFASKDAAYLAIQLRGLTGVVVREHQWGTL